MVIAIIGILASVVLSSINDSRVAARDAVRQSEVRPLQNAIELYYSANEHYPCPGTNCSTDTSTAVIALNSTSVTSSQTNFYNHVSNYIGRLTPDRQLSGGSIQYRRTADGQHYVLRIRLESNPTSWCSILGTGVDVFPTTAGWRAADSC